MCAEFKDDAYIYAFDSLKHNGLLIYSMNIMTFLVMLFDASLIFILYQELCSTTFG